MIIINSDEMIIKEAQEKLINNLESYVDEKVFLTIGFQGETIERTISWSNNLRIWFFSETLKGSRYVNAFGIDKPKRNAHISNVCEINFPLKGINRRIGAAIAQDDKGSIYIIHRGKIGGGRSGIGKSLFEENYRGKLISVDDGGDEKTMALIGELNSPNISNEIVNFVYEVNRIKGLLRAGKT